MKALAAFSLAVAGMVLHGAEPHPLSGEYNHAWQLTSLHLSPMPAGTRFNAELTAPLEFVIGLAAHYRPVSAFFAFYGLGWSAYTHFLARGSEVEFAKDTPMEIRFGAHQSAPPTAGEIALNK